MQHLHLEGLGSTLDKHEEHTSMLVAFAASYWMVQTMCQSQKSGAEPACTCRCRCQPLACLPSAWGVVALPPGRTPSRCAQSMTLLIPGDPFKAALRLAGPAIQLCRCPCMPYQPQEHAASAPAAVASVGIGRTAAGLPSSVLALPEGGSAVWPHCSLSRLLKGWEVGPLTAGFVSCRPMCRQVPT